MQLRKALDAVPCALRVLISGTPIQVRNGAAAARAPPRRSPWPTHPSTLPLFFPPTPPQNNLLEMWALFSFVAPEVLGDAADFRRVPPGVVGVGPPMAEMLRGRAPPISKRTHLQPAHGSGALRNVRLPTAPPLCRTAPLPCRDRYERVITNGTDKHATEYERERGAVAAARLRQVGGGLHGGGAAVVT